MKNKIKSIINNVKAQYNNTRLCAGVGCIKDNIKKTASVLAKHGITANMVSICGFTLGMLAVNCLANGAYNLALLLILVNRYGDALDGAIAKIKGKTDFGVFLDASLDYIFYAAVIFGFAMANPADNALAASFLLFGFATSACALLAYGVIAHAKNTNVLNESPFYLGGLAQGAETVTAFVLLCIVPNWFVSVALILGCWCLIKSLLVVSSAYFNFVVAAKGK